MRRRQIFSQLNPRDNRAPVPSGAGMGAAAVTPAPSPVSRAEEEAKAQIWRPYPPSKQDMKAIPDGAELETCLNTATDEVTYRVLPPVEINLDQFMTPGTDPEAVPLVKRRGWPKGKKRCPKTCELISASTLRRPSWTQ